MTDNSPSTDVAEDDWASALAEQTSAAGQVAPPPAAAAPAGSQVFQPLEDRSRSPASSLDISRVLDVLINGYLIAQGEVVVVNEKYGIRLTDIITPSERMQKLARA